MNEQYLTWYDAKRYVSFRFRRLALVISLFLTVAFSIGGSGVEVPATSPAPLAYVKGLIQQKEAELRRLEAGEVGVGGYALFGASPPKEFLSGNALDDQYYQSSSRIEVLRNQLSGLRLLRAYYEQGKQTLAGGLEKLLTAEELNLRDACVTQSKEQNMRNANLGGGTTIQLRSKVGGRPETAWRIFIWFDDTKVASRAGDLDKVILRLYNLARVGEAKYAAGRVTVKVYRVLGPWNEGRGKHVVGTFPTARDCISWANQPTYNPIPWASAAIVHSEKSYSVRWDISELTKAWVAGSYPNYGLVLIGDTESKLPYVHVLASREFPGNQAFRPKLLVTKTAGQTPPGAGAKTKADKGGAPTGPSVRAAYQAYIAAYNRLTQLMSQGKGDTPEAQKAYEEYKRAKANYEKLIRR